MAGREILIRFLGDASSVKKASKDTASALGQVTPAAAKAAKATDLIEKGTRRLDPAGKAAQKAVTGFSKVLTRVLGPAAGAANAAVAGLSKQMLQSGDTAKAGAVAAGAVAGAAFVKLGIDGVKSQVDLAKAVTATKKATGETAENASLLNGAMRRLGIGGDDANTAFNRLASTAENLPGKLAEVGVQVARNKDGSVDFKQTLEAVAAAYQGTDDATRKAAIGQAAFGAGFQTMIPLLSKTRDELDHLYDQTSKDNELLSEDDLAKAKEFEKSTRELRLALQGLERQLSGQSIPQMTAFANALSKVAQLDASAAGVSFSVGDAARGAISPVTLLAGKLRDAWKAAKGDGDDTGVAMGWMGSAADRADKLADEAAEAERAIDGLRSALTSMVAADKALADAHGDLGKAQAGLNDAQAAYNKLAKEPLVDLKAVAAAERDLADVKETLADKQEAYQRILHTAAVDEKAVTEATKDRARAVRDMEDALNAQLDAQKALRDLENPSARTLGDAQADLKQAQNDMVRATGAQIEAHKALQKAEQSGRTTAEELKEARLDSSDADLAAYRATQRLRDAEKAAYDLTPTGVRLTDEYKDATRAVVDAKQASADAADAERQADAALATARLGNTNRARELRDAERELRDAQDAVKASSDKVAEAHAGSTTRANELKEASDRVKDAEVKVREAEEAIPAAAYAAATSHQTAAGALANAGNNAYVLRGQLDALARAYPAIKPIIDDLTRNLPTAPGSRGPHYDTNFKPGQTIEGYDSGGMVGGPVGKPRLAIVHGGERVLTPEEQRGSGMPVRASAALVSAGGGAVGGLGPVSIVINVHGVDDPERLAKKLEGPLQAMLLRAAGDRPFVDRVTTEMVRNRKRSGPAGL